MLVNTKLGRAWGRKLTGTHDEHGVALVLVIILMLVGFVAAALIATSVMFTITSNSSNKSITQAFIAAESGRDKVVSQIASGCTDTGALQASGATPMFTAQAYTTTGAQPTTPAGLTQTCPTKDTKYVLIQSKGTGPDGSSTTINSVYRWSATFSNVPGGVVTYFSGNVTQGVSHYTGDLVLRNGNWSCNIGGTLDGDLYVLTGTAQLANNCKINGDVWANGSVSSNSQSWQVNANPSTGSTGSITTNGYVSFSSNGSPSVAGSITAKGDINLTAQGGVKGTVAGTVTTQSATANVDPNAWTTGTVTNNSPNPPTFTPTLDWLLAATKWIDLNNTSGWGTLTPGNCSKLQNGNTATAYVQPMLSAATIPLVLDFTACTQNQYKQVTLDLLAGSAVTRDMAIIVAPGSQMNVTLGGLTSSGTHQLLLIHSDANINDVDSSGAPVPTCGNGNTSDGFGTNSVLDPNLHVMVYSPCGLNGTVTASFVGQLYTNDSTNFHSGSAYTCTSMEWPSALPKLGCKIKGPGGIGNIENVTQGIGALVYQQEQ